MRPGDASRAEVVAALSLATDLAMGQPLEGGLRICRTALALADAAGLDDEQRCRVCVWYVALLRHVGCTGDAHAMAEILGDDIAFHAAAMPLDASSPKTLGPFVLGHLVRTNGLIGAAAKLAQMVAARDRTRRACARSARWPSSSPTGSGSARGCRATSCS